MTAPEPSFEHLPAGAGPEAPVLLHVPHSSTVIPAHVRADIVLDDRALDRELDVMTDWHTEALARSAAERAGHTIELFVNRLSRLVVDPERFPDEREELAQMGMAAVYTATHDLGVLRHPDPERDARLVETYFIPYAAAMADAVEGIVARHGRCVILDLHSYPTQPLPYELHPDAPPADVCIGTDQTFTPEWLAAAAGHAASRHGRSHIRDGRFRGTYVPQRQHEAADRHVSSVMLEIRRATYQQEPAGALHEGADSVAEVIADVIRAAAARPA